MRTIGLIGGMSWQSSAVYYRLLNQGVERRLGGLHSAKTVLTSVDFDRLTTLQRNEDWEMVGEILSGAARATRLAQVRAGHADGGAGHAQGRREPEQRGGERRDQ